MTEYLTPADRVEEFAGLEKLRDDLLRWLEGEEAQTNPVSFWVWVKVLVQVIGDLEAKAN